MIWSSHSSLRWSLSTYLKIMKTALRKQISMLLFESDNSKWVIDRPNNELSEFFQLSCISLHEYKPGPSCQTLYPHTRSKRLHAYCNTGVLWSVTFTSQTYIFLNHTRPSEGICIDYHNSVLNISTKIKIKNSVLNIIKPDWSQWDMEDNQNCLIIIIIFSWEGKNKHTLSYLVTMQKVC